MPLPRPVRLALGAAVTAALFYAALLAALWAGQEKLLFVPTPLAADHPLRLDPDVQERWVDVPGARLHALHLQRPGARGLVFLLHGNAGNLESWFVDLDFWRSMNLDLVMIDYRGYGKSSGRIESEAQLHADVRAAWDAFAPAYAGRPRVLFGRSLGTGLAAVLAAEVQPELTVLVSPYESMVALAAEHYPFVPAALLRYPLRTDQALPRVRGPVLLVHGAEDTLIGPQHARRLQALRPGTGLALIEGAGHNDLQRFPPYRDALRAAMAPR